VRTLQHEDRMDSFVLSETLKYLYLLFAKPEELYLGKLTVNLTLPTLIYLFRTKTSVLCLLCGSVLILVGNIRILNRIGNADPDQGVQR
jgi:hypothetical protein